jgi:hypothetical protein
MLILRCQRFSLRGCCHAAITDAIITRAAMIFSPLFHATLSRRFSPLPPDDTLRRRSLAAFAIIDGHCQTFRLAIEPLSPPLRHDAIIFAIIDFMPFHDAIDYAIDISLIFRYMAIILPLLRFYYYATYILILFAILLYILLLKRRYAIVVHYCFSFEIVTYTIIIFSFVY